MDASFVPTQTMFSIGQQQPASFLSFQQQCWLLQQPCDSGYVEGDNDLFAQAFKQHDMKSIDAWVMDTSNTPELSHAATSPFEYADSLVLPPKQLQPYETSYTTSYSLDGPAAYNVPHYNHKYASSVSSGSMVGYPQTTSQHIYRPSKEFTQAQAPTLQPSLMEDSASVADMDVVSKPRQREHHTAVEQRYRKNLNEQFNNLRSAVPDIQTSQPQRAGQPAKPSKCEVLAGAVDYIRRLEEENQRLKAFAQEGVEASRKRARTMV